MNYDLMEAMFTSMDKYLEEQQLTPLQLKDLMISVHATFGRWTELLKQLLKHCNDLLQLNIVASNTVIHKNKATTVEKKIAEILMESRVRHNKPFQSGWMATAEHFLELAKVKLTAVTEGKFKHEDLLQKTWNQEEQRILLDERQQPLREVQRRMPAPLIGAAGTSRRGKPPPSPRK